MAGVAALIALQIWLSLRITQVEHTLLALQEEYALAEQENAQLLWQISQHTSLERIKVESIRMGYGPSLQHEYRWVSGEADQPTPAPATTAHRTPPPSDPGPATSLVHVTQPVPSASRANPSGQMVGNWWPLHSELIATTWQQWANRLLRE